MRDLFHVPENYFLTHSVGCLPRSAEAALGDGFFAPWKSGTNWPEWMPMLGQFRNGLADLLAVEAASICPQVNVSSALTKILYSLPKDNPNTNTILLSKEDFPTIGFVFKQAERMGFNLKFIEGDPTDIRNWERAMDAHVAVVHITHALSNTSHLLPVGDICSLARKTGAISIVDIAQSFGVVPISLTDWQADFAIGTGVKFLCFGPGACFLYAAPNILPQCQPLDVGWFSHENPFEMDIAQFRYAKDAMRFFGGTPSPAPFVLGLNAIQLWQDIGLSEVHAQIDAKLTSLCETIPHEIIASPTTSGTRGGTLVINPPKREALRATIAAENILCDERPQGFRFSVQGYTSEAELETLMQVISKNHGI